MNVNSKEVAQLTAWAAILGGVFAYLNVGFMLAVTQGDMNLSLQGGYMLTASAQVREFFRWSMLADVLGFYLPLLIIGGYFWASFRDRAGALGDMAVLAIVVYVILGVAGASLQLAVLNPLASLHAEGGETAKVAAEAAWTSIATASQKGLWWCEGPVVLFWGLVVGKQLKTAGWGKSILWPLSIVGWCFGLFFVCGFFQSLAVLTNVLLVVVVLIFPLWLMMFGTQLLRGPKFVLADQLL
ncbi:hypothetical protein NAV33_12905 [Pseudomonas stutzeri]|uniref:hypothetical protein n=1 Tax=Stutzerimonas stutzeri TaxID=316 RepID=UPI00210CECD3|nr:hypothetical protein [Stutzerimonas stutzeri]MCQ4312792.1 hypothetical protein [Stutzerimonas stutzeri]